MNYLKGKVPGVLLSVIGYWAPGLFGFSILSGLSLYVWMTILNHPVIILKPQAGLALISVADEDR
jgi:hypothetical protein